LTASSEPIGSYTKTGYVGAITPQLIDAMIGGLAHHPSGPRSPASKQLGGGSRRARPCDRISISQVHAAALLLAIGRRRRTRRRT